MLNQLLIVGRFLVAHPPSWIVNMTVRSISGSLHSVARFILKRTRETSGRAPEIQLESR